MSKIVSVPGANGSCFAGIQRDDDTLLFASDYVKSGSKERLVLDDGTLCWFVSKADFARALDIAGLQPVYGMAPHQDVDTNSDTVAYVTPRKEI